MSRAYSEELRDQVLDAVAAGSWAHGHAPNSGALPPKPLNTSAQTNAKCANYFKAAGYEPE